MEENSVIVTGVKTCTKESLIREGRKQGNTTRLVDYYIQQLFETGSCTCIDHTDSKLKNLIVRHRVRIRLISEHKLKEKEDFEVNNLVITLIKK